MRSVIPFRRCWFACSRLSRSRAKLMRADDPPQRPLHHLRRPDHNRPRLLRQQGLPNPQHRPPRHNGGALQPCVLPTGPLACPAAIRLCRGGGRMGGSPAMACSVQAACRMSNISRAFPQGRLFPHCAHRQALSTHARSSMAAAAWKTRPAGMFPPKAAAPTSIPAATTSSSPPSLKGLAAVHPELQAIVAEHELLNKAGNPSYDYWMEYAKLTVDDEKCVDGNIAVRVSQLLEQHTLPAMAGDKSFFIAAGFRFARICFSCACRKSISTCIPGRR